MTGPLNFPSSKRPRLFHTANQALYHLQHLSIEYGVPIRGSAVLCGNRCDRTLYCTSCPSYRYVLPKVPGTRSVAVFLVPTKTTVMTQGKRALCSASRYLLVDRYRTIIMEPKKPWVALQRVFAMCVQKYSGLYRTHLKSCAVPFPGGNCYAAMH